MIRDTQTRALEGQKIEDRASEPSALNSSQKPVAAWRLTLQGAIALGGVWGGAAKLVRACGGCLGARRLKGVADCDKFRGAVKQAPIRKYPS